MGRSFSANEAEDILERQWKIKQYLSFVAAGAEKYREDVRCAADEIVMEEVMLALSEVPVEEMRIGQQGFRLGTLIDRGFHTMADVAAVDAGALASACGISKSAAQSVRSAAEEAITTTKKWVCVRLDPEKKTDAAAKLLAALSKYIHGVPVAEKCQKLLEEYGSRVDNAIDQLDPSVSGMDWFFTSPKNRVKAEDAFTLLNELFEGEYGQQAHELLAQYQALGRTGEREAWIEYVLSKDKFTTALKKLVPDLRLDES